MRIVQFFALYSNTFPLIFGDLQHLRTSCGYITDSLTYSQQTKEHCRIVLFWHILSDTGYIPHPFVTFNHYNLYIYMHYSSTYLLTYVTNCRHHRQHHIVVTWSMKDISPWKLSIDNHYRPNATLHIASTMCTHCTTLYHERLYTSPYVQVFPICYYY